ncbi:sugar-binding transcriptional regulator [Sporosarcina pasteurii]|uniref:Central glycolytic genes regulator n=1 Tax=Sporosarcina pasteurii TaxID=1474 RepID=A0A380CBU4_SPOPA|nr:sugar-binding domain-containing protein [Sporosarcina pasteurii]MDS9472696.1 sugar-binding domain-containing protein [Sporosarcina pasteurii]QBQ04354.1 hypothetical protein E2C16_00920 [Sporosarcina pasteurii]SUJ15690.1 Central glycolytic genes regulator [Sporosarcina pasteurii]
MDISMEAYGKLVPEMITVLQERFRILKYINMAGPIGRRPLGEMAGLSERETRTMIDLLRTQQLINVAKNGVTVTDEGLAVLTALEPIMEKWTGRSSLERRLQEYLGISAVKIVAGDCDRNPVTKNLLGLKTAEAFVSAIDNGQIIAVTGGSTIASIPNYIEKATDLQELLFIAARGGVGEDIGLQANVIAASFAEACGGKYRTFYYPESLSEETHKAFQNEPSVRKMIQLYEQVDCVIHGIGEAQTMANLRESSAEEKEMLQTAEAKGEAFGYYFNRTGKAVHRIRTIGIQIDQLERVPLIYAVAGGSSKAEAILAYMSTAPKQTVLITDEAAAQEMLKQIAN